MNQVLSIRPAGTSDLHNIWRIHKEAIQSIREPYTPEEIEKWASKYAANADAYAKPISAMRVFVAEANGKLLGFGQFNADTGVIERIYVLPSASRNGVGRALVSEAEQRAIAAGFSKLYLCSSLNAVEFYHRCGFVHGQGDDPASGSVADDGILMVKPLPRTEPVIRPLAIDDDVARLTALIRAAYAPHAKLGLRYWGTHQTVEDTAQRFAAGYALIAVKNGEYVGTVTVRAPQPGSPVALYRDSDTWSLSQFAVAPSFKGQGLGKALHAAALAYAGRQGARIMALDTAQPAESLIAMWRAWGYKQAGTCDWRPHTNYLSVLMSRPVHLATEPRTIESFGRYPTR